MWLKVERKGWRGSPYNTRESIYTKEQKFCSAAPFSLWQVLVFSLLKEKGTNKGKKDKHMQGASVVSTWGQMLCCHPGRDTSLWAVWGMTQVSLVFSLAALSYSKIWHPSAPKSSGAPHRSCEQWFPHTTALPLGVLCLLAILSSRCWEAQHCNIRCQLK